MRSQEISGEANKPQAIMDPKNASTLEVSTAISTLQTNQF